MNPIASLYGCVKVLLGRADWSDHFDLSPRGLKQSFAALAFILPAIYLIAYGVQLERDLQFGETGAAIPLGPFGIILGLYLLTFSSCAYGFAMVLEVKDRFRAWVITRHWTIVWLALSAAVLFGFYILGLLPFAIVNTAALIAFLAVLLIDIRIVQNIIPFKIGPAILIGCVINAMGLVVLLLGLEQIL